MMFSESIREVFSTTDEVIVDTVGDQRYEILNFEFLTGYFNYFILGVLFIIQMDP